MRFIVTMPEEVFVKLESIRGLIPRSTFIQSLVEGFGAESKKQVVKEISSGERGLPSQEVGSHKTYFK